VPAKLTVSGALYQPFAFAPRSGVALTCGAVASYLTTTERGETLPARSRQAPLMATVAASGPEYDLVASQESSPEVASFPAKATVSGWLYQPLTSAARDAVALAWGAVSS
jgi:hypothetical protein